MFRRRPLLIADPHTDVAALDPYGYCVMSMGLDCEKFVVLCNVKSMTRRWQRALAADPLIDCRRQSGARLVLNGRQIHTVHGKKKPSAWRRWRDRPVRAAWAFGPLDA